MGFSAQQEQQWLQQLRQGDQHAFTAIYTHFWEELLRFAYKKTGDLSIAEDLVQELFVSIWLKREGLLIAQSLRAYLLMALKYQIIDYIRANITRQTYLASLQQTIQTSLATNEEEVNEITDLVQQSTGEMPERMRLIFEMSRYQGCSTEEIAHQLNLSEQTVRNQISSALKRIRLRLGDYLATVLLTLL